MTDMLFTRRWRSRELKLFAGSSYQVAPFFTKDIHVHVGRGIHNWFEYGFTVFLYSPPPLRQIGFRKGFDSRKIQLAGLPLSAPNEFIYVGNITDKWSLNVGFSGFVQVRHVTQGAEPLVRPCPNDPKFSPVFRLVHLVQIWVSHSMLPSGKLRLRVLDISKGKRPAQMR